MSNPDSFINEVTEEVRRDRLFRLARRWGWVPALAILVVVGGAAFLEWQKARDRAAAQAFGDALISALEADTAAERRDALSQVDAAGDQAAVVRLLQAAEAQEAGDIGSAVTALQAVADDNTLPESYRQLAMLKRVMIGGSALPVDERRATLDQLAAAGSPFRPMAMEQRALLALEEGDRAGAIERLRALGEESDVTPSMRQRANQMIVALGAEPEAG